MEKLKVASLFCGCGGTDLGILGGFTFNNKLYESNNTKVVYANDNDPKACELFETNFGLKPDNRDIREVKSSELPDFEILTGGFPCQSFSIVAQNPPRLGISDEKGMLFFEMCRILKDKKPLCFIAESVKGIITANKGQALPLILKEFESCGYNVTYQILNSVNYGIPQKRERVIIVGFRKDLKVNFQFPKPIYNDSQFVPLRIALEDTVDKKYYFSKQTVAGMIKANKKIKKGRVQNINKPCNTVGAHLAKVSLNSTDPVLKVNGRYRRFTPREVARIQSFPDSYLLTGSETSQHRYLGNAITPVLSWHITQSILDALSDESLKNAAE